MRIALMMVASVNGKITKGDNPDVRAFSSDEDAKLFEKLKDTYPLIIMGRKTYEAARPRIRLSPDTLRIVVTRHPNIYADETVPGQLEFTDEAPHQLVTRLEKAGHNEALLAGGAEINAIFLEAGLVDEVHLTIEPILLGSGKQLFDTTIPDTALQLKTIQKLNNQGTVHVVYNVMQSAKHDSH